MSITCSSQEWTSHEENGTDALHGIWSPAAAVQSSRRTNLLITSRYFKSVFHTSRNVSARPAVERIFRGNLRKKNDSGVSEMDEPRGNYSSKEAEPDKSEEIFLREAEARAGWCAAYLRHLSIPPHPLLPLLLAAFSPPIKQTNKWMASQLLLSHLMEENILAGGTKSLTLPQTAAAQRQKQP